MLKWRYGEEIEQLSKMKNTDEIRVRGIRSGGYGQLPKIIMVDPNIPLAAKGIYAYFVSFTYVFPVAHRTQHRP